MRKNGAHILKCKRVAVCARSSREGWGLNMGAYLEGENDVRRTLAKIVESACKWMQCAAPEEYGCILNVFRNVFSVRGLGSLYPMKLDILACKAKVTSKTTK